MASIATCGCAAAALGGPTMGVDAEPGGGGAGLLDLELAAGARRCGAGADAAGRRVGHRAACSRSVATAVVLRSTGCGTDAPPVAVLALHPARDGVVRLVPAGAVAEIVVGIDDDELVVVEAEPDGTARAHDLGRDGARRPLAACRHAHGARVR